MKEKNRTENSIKNSSTAVIAQICSVMLSFIVRTVFIRFLGNSYLGINGLFSNVLSLLSFAELGFGTAIVYAMYKPIAEKDEKAVSAFMNFYGKIYRGIGCFILIAGAALIPFLGEFIGDTSQIPTDLPSINVIYMLYVVNSASSYFFNYKRSLVTASQNGYIDSINQLQFNIARNILQIAVLVLFRSFLLYLIIQILCTLLGNVFISLKADKLFPYLKDNKNEKLSHEAIRNILKNVMAMACHKLGSVIVSGTDNILITKYVGLVATGQYSNYVLLTTTVRTFYLQIINPLTASVGNLIATENREKCYDLFRKILFLNSYIAVFCATCLLGLSNSFIYLFWGHDSILPMTTVYLIMLVFYINCIRKSAEMYIDTVGLFWQIKWKSVIEAIINLVVSIFCAAQLKMGITGVLIGTLVSDVATNLWWEPFVVYKYFFEKPLYLYFIDYVRYFVAFIVSVGIVFAANNIVAISFTGFIIKAVVAAIVPNLVMILFFGRTKEFEYFLNLAKKIGSKIVRR